MATVAERLADAAQRLDPVTDTPRLDAELLLAHTLGLSRASLLARMHEPAPGEPFETLVKRRAGGEPLAYILGSWEFYSLDFKIEAPILVPRPETEHLVEVVLEFVGNGPATVLDLCTGSGCVAVAVAVHAPACEIVATDRNPKAVSLAARNARRYEVDQRIAFRQGDLFEALQVSDGPFDAVCANPPYVAESDWPSLSATIREFEDPDALLAGKDGLDCIRRIVQDARAYLRSGGLLAFEIGQGQSKAVEDLMLEAGYETIAFRKDLAGISRIASGTAPG